MKPGATLGLSHGFLLGVLKNDGVDFRNDINVVLVAPKVIISLGYTMPCLRFVQTVLSVGFAVHHCLMQHMTPSRWCLMTLTLPNGSCASPSCCSSLQ